MGEATQRRAHVDERHPSRPMVKFFGAALAERCQRASLKAEAACRNTDAPP
jgi:hypothetical protein